MLHRIIALSAALLLGCLSNLSAQQIIQSNSGFHTTEQKKAKAKAQHDHSHHAHDGHDHSGHDHSHGHANEWSLGGTPPTHFVGNWTMYATSSPAGEESSEQTTYSISDKGTLRAKSLSSYGSAHWGFDEKSSTLVLLDDATKQQIAFRITEITENKMTWEYRQGKQITWMHFRR